MATLASAHIKVTSAWVRVTVPGQQATGAFMKITSTEAVKLSSVSSSAAGFSQIHEMKMDEGVMKMRALPSGLDIPADKAVELSSGGVHVMLMDLKQTISAGQSVPLDLRFTNAKGHLAAVSVVAKAGFTSPHK
tara:strand:+ start:421 stop:822 length:402 start_codon:yes stop_codon:yes gene_type:complete